MEPSIIENSTQEATRKVSPGLGHFEAGDPPTSSEREPSVTYKSTGLFKATCISIFPSGGRDTNWAYVLVLPKTLDPHSSSARYGILWIQYYVGTQRRKCSTL